MSQSLYMIVAMLAAGLAAYLVPLDTKPQVDLCPRSFIAQLERMSAQAERMRFVGLCMQSNPPRKLGSYLAAWLTEHGCHITETLGALVVVLGAPMAGLVGALLSFSLAGALVLFCGYVMALPFCVKTLDQRFEAQISHEMPLVFRMLASSLGSGKTLAQSLEYVGLHEDGHIAREFEHAALELRFGESSQSALNGLAQRLDTVGVRLLVATLSISQRTGSPLDAMLSRCAHMVEQQEGLERTLSVKTAQVRLSVKIVCCMPLVMLTALSLISPDFQRGLLTPTGITCVAIALAMDALALVIIRRLMKGVV